MRSALKYTLFCLLAFFALQGQDRPKIARALEALHKTNPDSTLTRAYLTLAAEYISFNNDSSLYYNARAKELLQRTPDLHQEAYAKYLEGLVYYMSSALEKTEITVNEALTITKGTTDKLLLSKCHNLLGAVNFNLGNYNEALLHYNEKLELVNSLHDTLSIIETHYNISLINNAEGSFYRSLEHNYTGLALAERSKDSVSMLIASEGLGLSYTRIGDTKNAIIFLKKALQLALIKNRRYDQSGILIDIGSVYLSMSQYEAATYYYNRAQSIAFTNGDRISGALAMSGRAMVLFDQVKLQEAKDLFGRAIYYYKESNYAKGLAENNVHLAECDLGLGKYAEAKSRLIAAIAALSHLNEKQTEENAYHILSKVYDKLNDTDSAYLCFKRHVLISDSLQARSSLKKISEYESNLEKKKLEQERSLTEKAARAELQKQKQIRNTVMALSVLILVLLLFVYRNYKLKQKASIAISEQKKIIEHKNKDIVDSINYSRRLQEAVLSSPAGIEKMLPGSFVIYKPKGNVSSVFYFAEKGRDSDVHVAVAGCTGQGVPGAFMSIIGHNILKQALKEQSLKTPAQILDFLNKGIKRFLRTEEQSGTLADGIGIAYCIFNRERNELSYAGADCAAWLFRENLISENGIDLVSETGTRKLYRLKPDLRAAGFVPAGESFRNLLLKPQKGDTLLLCRGLDLQSKDGISEALAKCIGGIRHDSKALHVELNAIIDSHHQNGTQTDDLCIIGINI